eukprot:g81670.t1
MCNRSRGPTESVGFEPVRFFLFFLPKLWEVFACFEIEIHSSQKVISHTFPASHHLQPSSQLVILHHTIFSSESPCHSVDITNVRPHHSYGHPLYVCEFIASVPQEANMSTPSPSIQAEMQTQPKRQRRSWNVASLKRSLKDSKYTPMENLVREATSNDPLGAPEELLQEIGKSVTRENYHEMSRMLWRRISDTDYPLHVAKGLELLIYLLQYDRLKQQVILDSRIRVNELEELTSFHTDKGNTKGGAIRERARWALNYLKKCEEQEAEEKKQKRNGAKAKPATLVVLSPEKWTCNACTYPNDQHASFCDFCRTRRGQESQPEIVQAQVIRQAKVETETRQHELAAEDLLIKDDQPRAYQVLITDKDPFLELLKEEQSEHKPQPTTSVHVSKPRQGLKIMSPVTPVPRKQVEQGLFGDKSMPGAPPDNNPFMELFKEEDFQRKRQPTTSVHVSKPRNEPKIVSPVAPITPKQVEEGLFENKTMNVLFEAKAQRDVKVHLSPLSAEERARQERLAEAAKRKAEEKARQAKLQQDEALRKKQERIHADKAAQAEKARKAKEDELKSAKAEKEAQELERHQQLLAIQQREREEQAKREELLERQRIADELERTRQEAARLETERAEREARERELARQAEEEARAKEAQLEAERKEREACERELARLAEEEARAKEEQMEREREKKMAEELERQEAARRLEAERAEREARERKLAARLAEEEARAKEAQLEAERKEREARERELAARQEEEARAKEAQMERERQKMAEELERQEAARLEAERTEREAHEKELAARLAEEEARAKEAQLEAERKEREARDRELAARLAEEEARAKEEQMERERQKKMAEELERQEAARLEAERAEREARERELAARLAEEEARAKKEQMERERQQKMAEELERQEAARLEAERAEREAREREVAARLVEEEARAKELRAKHREEAKLLLQSDLNLIRELAAYANFFNVLLRDLPDANTELASKVLPLKNESPQAAAMDLLAKISNGILLSLVINSIRPDCIDLSVLHTEEGMPAERAEENILLVLGAARSMIIGVREWAVQAAHLIDPFGSKENVLSAASFVWQLVRQQLLDEIDVRKRPDLVALSHETDGSNPENRVAKLTSLDGESLLFRWLKFHLPDLQESCLPDENDLRTLLGKVIRNVDVSAQSVPELANQLKVRFKISEEDMKKDGNHRLRLAFCASIFHASSALSLTEQQDAPVKSPMEVDSSVEIGPGYVHSEDDAASSCCLPGWCFPSSRWLGKGIWRQRKWGARTGSDRHRDPRLEIWHTL